MRLYLDEDIADPLLARALRQAGHDVQVPADVGMLGKSDPRQLTHAVRGDRVCLTRNHDDYDDLHILIQAVAGRHAGILAVRRDDDKRRNMKHLDIVRAIRNLEGAGVPVANEYIILNQWR